MPTDFNLKDWIDTVYKVNVVVNIAIIPPWSIRDVENHAAVNFGTLAVTAVAYFVLRLFTPPGNYGLTEVGVIVVFSTVFLLLIGMVVNFFDPTLRAVKLSNRWSTFLIISFL